MAWRGQPGRFAALVGVVAVALLLALWPAAPAQGAFPGENGRIAMDYLGGVFSLRPDGRDLRRHSPRGFDPAYSPNGRMLAYGCGTEYSTSCRPRVGIRIRRVDGRGRWRSLTHNRTDDQPAWSPDGRSVVFTRYPGGDLLRPELWIYHGGGSRRLTEGSSPAWSVRGEIAFVRGGFEIYVIRPDGTDLRHLADGLDPEWSPDGRRVVYDANPGLYTIGREGRRRRRLAPHGLLPDFSPDGRWVVFTAGAHDRIVTMRRNGRDRRVIFQSEGDLIAASPDWQPLPRRG